MMKLLLFSLGILGTWSYLVPPLNRGVIGKVSQQFIQDLAQEVADRATTEMKKKVLSDSMNLGDGDWFRYWNMRITTLSLYPTINLHKDSSRELGRLVVDASLRGSIALSSSWHFTYDTWLWTFEFEGTVYMSSSNFHLTNRVFMGDKGNGEVGFAHDSTSCSLSLGSLYVDVSGSWFSWLFNFLISYFDTATRNFLEESTCVVVNRQVAAVTQDMETAIMDEEPFSQPFRSDVVEIDIRPTTITGGDTCAAIVILGHIDVEKAARDENDATTGPFIPPTLHPKTDDPSPPLPARRKRFSGDWCDTLPGSSRGVSVIITEDVITRYIESIYLLDLLKIDLMQAMSEDDSMTFDVTRDGSSLGSAQIPTTANSSLNQFEQKTLKISTTGAPIVRIDKDGISVYVNVRARVAIQHGEILVKSEFQTMAKFLGTFTFTYSSKAGQYVLVPTVSASVDIWTVKLFIDSDKQGPAQSKLDDDDELLEPLEAMLNEMIEGFISKYIEDDLQGGIPLNIPSEFFTITETDIVYSENYVLVSVDNIGINLDSIEIY